ncbi:MAG: prolyl oligopeptidase family serine peptidase [Actinobacteria bacterium]|nr:prolyl oligopeptidase family serine peptidase [Actinomycetota bacterium]
MRLTPEEYPLRQAATQRFSLGRPRSFTAGAARVLFVRSSGPVDPVHSLWALDLASGEERLLADPRVLMPAPADLPALEAARRERLREGGAGIVAYACDRRRTIAVFALGGKLMVTHVESGSTEQLAIDGAVLDPRPSPDGRLVAYVADDALWAVEAGGHHAPRRLAGELDPAVSWGLAEFLAAEEMDRTRGFWWAPDSQRLAVARVDVGPVATWWIAGPVDPDAEPRPQRYPAAGTANADVSLAVVDLQGRHTPVAWDRIALPYLAAVTWDQHGLLVTLQSRDQRHLVVLEVDPDSGATVERVREHDDTWVELVHGSPTFDAAGRLAHAVQDHATGWRRMALDGELVTPPGRDVTAVLGSHEDGVLVALADHTSTRVALARPGGCEWLDDEAGGVAWTTADSGTLVHVRSGPGPGTTWTVTSDHGTHRPRSAAEEAPVFDVAAHAGSHGDIAWRLYVPAGDGPFPVLLDPYGGPHARRVLDADDTQTTSTWFATQGFAVIVADGAGAPGRGLACERAVHGDLAGPPLQAQIRVLELVDAAHPGVLDRSRVGIRGWSFGGYLAALAVLRRPDVFHAAVAGAPVTEWLLYDTHYTERYLGDPAEQPEAYLASSLLGDAASLERPLLLIHGLADDNVVVAHSLRLSRALLEAGRPHTFLPLSGVTHMTPQAEVAANLLVLQQQFLQEHLAPR